MASDKTAIEWCDSSWNPVTGCSHVSAGCEACYAEALSLRFGFSKKPWTASNAAENVIVHPERLAQPLRWRKPRRIFVNSMSDLFHERIPDEYIAAVFGVMAATPRHTFQILTKRPERMRAWFARVDAWADRARAVFPDDTPDWRRWHCLLAAGINHLGGGELSCAATAATPWPLPNVWLGVSIEQDRWCSRVDVLRGIPATVRFISAEPLLEPLPSLNLDGIDWIITGGESGHTPDERSMVQRCQWHGQRGTLTRLDSMRCAGCDGTGWEPKPWALAEVRRLCDLARSSGTAFLHKQWGGATPKSGGRLLDGRTWDEYPKETAHATH